MRKGCSFFYSLPFSFFCSLGKNVREVANLLWASCNCLIDIVDISRNSYQAEIGSISSDIKILQEKSMDMGLKLKNRKVLLS